MVAYDRSQIHLLAIEALQYGIPMREVSQAAGRAGGSMARHTTTLIETLTAHQLRFFPCPELRQHLANARFSTRSGGDRLVKATASKKIDLAIALTMAVGTLHDILREQAQNPPEEYEVISAHDYLLSQGREPAHLGWDQGFGEGYSPNYFLPGYWEDEW